MKNYFTTTLIFASNQLKRAFRDPLTVIILMGLPVTLLVVFGFMYSSGGDITLRTAVVGHSEQQFAKDFEKSLGEIDVLKLSDESLSIDQAKENLKDGSIDAVIEIPNGFGAANNQGVPSGDLKLYFDESDMQTGQIITSVMNGIVDGTNKKLLNITMPLTIKQEPMSGKDDEPIHALYAIFTGMALLMVGVFGLASTLPADKKRGILRRLHVTPIKASQVNLGTMLAYVVIGSIIAIAMTLIAVLLFGMEIRGEIISLATFILLGLVLSVGFGLAISGIAKNTAQAETIGQVVFLVTLSLSGIWIPIVAMPEFLQNIVVFMPFAPIIEGIRIIVSEGVSLVGLLPQLGIMAVWIIVLYVVGFKTFRWE